jgi:broad specificity phosphatase PhoE
MHIRLRLALLALAIAVPAWAQPQPPAAAITTVIVVRHAERASSESDSPLSDLGRARAQALAQTLRDTPLRAIITSQFARTKETAEPIARLKQIAPDTIPADNLEAVIGRIKSFGGGTVLVVHHSNTVPAIVEQLGGRTEPMLDTEFDRFLIVRVTPAGASVLLLRYGAPPAQ